jgi:hypothetical protein
MDLNWFIDKIFPSLIVTVLWGSAVLYLKRLFERQLVQLKHDLLTRTDARNLMFER